MTTVQRTVENFNLPVLLRNDELLAQYTTFRVGGPAEVLAFPQSTKELSQLLEHILPTSIPVTILGGGANVVVSDRGIPGVVIWMGEMREMRRTGDRVEAQAGAAISDVSAFAAHNDLEGLDFIYAMPGSVGGAVWMNARCYGGEISHILERVEYVSMTGKKGVYHTQEGDFAYKISPFQDGSRVITSATFRLWRGATSEELWRRMDAIKADRSQKGHFEAPCAGSIFKNDRSIGVPSGQIIDGIGLRGLRHGGAQVSPRHGNIIINTGTATARDIRELVTDVQNRVYQATGHLLSPEVLFLGEWI